MNPESDRTAIVTGASSGIGEATAYRLAEAGYDLILTARRKDRLEEVSTEIEDAFSVKVSNHIFDIREREQVEHFVRSRVGSRHIDVLVNNAGLAAGFSLLHEGCVDDWDRMIDTNMKGLLYMTRGIAPLMVARNFGHIINIGSIAGVEVYPNGNVYCATKHAVKALSEGLRMELYDKGIRVTNIAPGMVETEFSLVRFHGDGKKAKNVYEGLKPLQAGDIADCIMFAVTRPAHVNVADMLVLASSQGSATLVSRKKN